MYTNSDATFYLHSKAGGKETYTRLYVEEVFWDDVRNSNFLKTGQKDSGSVLIVVPLESLFDPAHFTQGKDLAVKGQCSMVIDTRSQEALSKSLAALKSRGSFMVTTVDEKLYGSESVQHYELFCK